MRYILCWKKKNVINCMWFTSFYVGDDTFLAMMCQCKGGEYRLEYCWLHSIFFSILFGISPNLTNVPLEIPQFWRNPKRIQIQIQPNAMLVTVFFVVTIFKFPLLLRSTSKIGNSVTIQSSDNENSFIVRFSVNK